MRKSRPMLKLQYVGDKCLNLYDGTGRSTGPKRSIFGFLPIKSLHKEISGISSTGIINFSHKKLIFAIDREVVLWHGLLDI